MRQLSDKISQKLGENPLKPCLLYLSEKISQGEGILEALAKREGYVRSLQLKCCIRQVKKQRGVAVYKLNDYKLANEIERDISKYELLIQNDVAQISEMNSRICEDY